MAVINHREREELLGGLRSVPLRLLPALLTTLLLYLSGDMVELWALSWVALVPLCFACRGAGAPGAFILAAAAFLPAAVLQSLWLLDVEHTNAPLIWLAAGLIPALPFMAIELPICRSVPGPLRPLLIALLAVGCWRLLPVDAKLLIPFGGLIDSELVRFTYSHVGLALMAGLFTGLAWLSAELFYNPRKRGRTGWTGIAVAAALVIACAADWAGASIKPQPVGGKDTTSVHVMPGDGDLTARTEAVLAKRPTGMVIWIASVEDPELPHQAGELAGRLGANMVVLRHTPKVQHVHVFLGSEQPAAVHTWFDGDTAPLVLEGTRGVIVPGVGRIRIYPILHTPEHWATIWDLELYLGNEEPVHPAQLGYWLRELRREALIRGSRQVCAWDGGAAAIDGRGRVVAHADGEVMTAHLPAAEERGQPLGRARLTYMEKILGMAAPVLLLMLVLLTPVRWGKLRYRARQQEPDVSLAIEEIVDDETTISQQQRDTITRRFERGD